MIEARSGAVMVELIEVVEDAQSALVISVTFEPKVKIRKVDLLAVGLSTSTTGDHCCR